MHVGTKSSGYLFGEGIEILRKDSLIQDTRNPVNPGMVKGVKDS
jgi:hypothetical protein